MLAADVCKRAMACDTVKSVNGPLCQNVCSDLALGAICLIIITRTTLV